MGVWACWRTAHPNRGLVGVTTWRWRLDLNTVGMRMLILPMPTKTIADNVDFPLVAYHCSKQVTLPLPFNAWSCQRSCALNNVLVANNIGGFLPGLLSHGMGVQSTVHCGSDDPWNAMSLMRCQNDVCQLAGKKLVAVLQLCLVLHGSGGLRKQLKHVGSALFRDAIKTSKDFEGRWRG